MRVLFWRRKNHRLIARMNGVIERSEAVRASFQPAPPRVVIDTTYVDWRAAQAAEPSFDETFERSGDEPCDPSAGQHRQQDEALAADGPVPGASGEAPDEISTTEPEPSVPGARRRGRIGAPLQRKPAVEAPTRSDVEAELFPDQDAGSAPAASDASGDRALEDVAEDAPADIAEDELSTAPAEVAAPPPAPAKRAAPAKAAEETPRRRDPRLAAQMPATLWREGMSQSLACTIRDRSASGAMLELPPDRYGDGITEFGIGDHLTLAMGTARERTSVLCKVVRIDGRRCGIRFAGPFHTQINKPRKPQAPAASAVKGGSAKSWLRLGR